MDGDIAGNQDAVFAFLGNPATHGLSEPVKRIDTHGAAVFLAGRDVYKVKRAVRFPYMDFSTLEKRKAACDAELVVNRANAPALYLGVLPITRKGDRLYLAGDGEIVEWAVHLRRFDERATLDRIAEKGPLGATIVDQLAGVIATAHKLAPRRADARNAATSLRRALLETVAELVDRRDIFAPLPVETLRTNLIAAFERAEPALLERGARGKVRRCHGDLHLRNVALIAGQPVLFDAIEFDEALATTDILYDLAFLVMDLCVRNFGEDANRLLNHYLWHSEDERGEIGGLTLMPLFLGLRAAIGAKIGVAQAELQTQAPPVTEAARLYCKAALGFLVPEAPMLVAIGGLSGTGKSTLAAKLAPSFGAAPGAVHLRSDIERKRVYAVPFTERLPDEAYGADVTARVYRDLLDLAQSALAAGRSVIVDATFLDRSERREIERLTGRIDAPFLGLWLDAPHDTRAKRVAAREGDASDATVAVVADQGLLDTGPIEWRRIDAGMPLETTAAAALSLIRPSQV